MTNILNTTYNNNSSTIIREFFFWNLSLPLSNNSQNNNFTKNDEKIKINLNQ